MISVAIQAGGKSRRMGQDKALVPLGGKPLIQHVVDRVMGLGEELFITTNRPERYTFLGLRLVEDEVPGSGALGGLHTALKAARGDRVLVLACDMPFISRRILEHILSLSNQADVVIPCHGGEYEPLHAVYARRCLSAVEAVLASGDQRIVLLFDQVEVLPVLDQALAELDPQGLSFFNVNTPQDLERAEQILARL
jgi:molybdopterin-guanine dinucleotide biosynthesis protein A